MVISANDLNIVLLSPEPLSCVCPDGRKSILNEVAWCGTLNLFPLSFVLKLSIVYGLSISNKSGLWTAIIDAVNDELKNAWPVTFLTLSKLTLGSALNKPPANSLLNTSPDVLFIKVPWPKKFGSGIVGMGLGGISSLTTGKSSSGGNGLAEFPWKFSYKSSSNSFPVPPKPVANPSSEIISGCVE